MEQPTEALSRDPLAFGTSMLALSLTQHMTGTEGRAHRDHGKVLLEQYWLGEGASRVGARLALRFGSRVLGVPATL